MECIGRYNIVWQKTPLKLHKKADVANFSYQYVYNIRTVADIFVAVVLPVVSNSVTPQTAAHQVSLSFLSPELAQIHVHWVGDATQPAPSLSSFLLLPSICPASGSFPKSQVFTSGGQRIGALVSASVPPANIQEWFTLGLTGLIFQSK